MGWVKYRRGTRITNTTAKYVTRTEERRGASTYIQEMIRLGPRGVCVCAGGDAPEGIAVPWERAGLSVSRNTRFTTTVGKSPLRIDRTVR